ncbi:hypothetical protein TWF102_006287 [Orbilia oligospora]|uniref:Uncharacterized protein n=1 Tax=Orbilia oligospora TaxID=2813651 RepID=A0A7C8NQE3_ORBOL|nr:hypothetical protein TWF706_001569 [Orbilia oligospora]KAF3086001.1 hypothetical protein TWF103_001879 [Orbilia oligospora]KAF3097776.1 hypothetical protein TWF102_006287 [Orbilia oligospora]KAF3123990.1 hypothetical protein TWF703_000566 [Orbilia oligospora]
MSNKQYKFRLFPSGEGDSIYVGELLEVPESEGTRCDGITIPPKLQFRLGERSNEYIGEVLDDKRHLEANDDIKRENDKEEGADNDKNNFSQKEGSSPDSDSSRTMQSEQSYTEIKSPEPQSSLPCLPSELNVLDEAPFKLEEIYMTNNRRPAIEIGKLPLSIRYEVFRWIFNHPEPDRGFEDILEIPEGWVSSLEDPWIS